MDDQKLHPSVQDFKQFVNKHPKLIANLRKKGRPWQEYYEKWMLLGEDDDYWEKFKEQNTDKTEKGEDHNADDETESKKKNMELFSQLLKKAEDMDMDKVQKQVHQLSNTISTVQEAISQFQQNKSSTVNQNQQQWYQD
ncbi:spore coat protein YlbD [Virgibacillus oceani]